MSTAPTSPASVTASNPTKPHNLSDAIASVITGLNYRPKNLEESRLTQQAAQKALADLVANTHPTAPAGTVPRGNPKKPLNIADVLAGINFCPNTLTAARDELAKIKDSLSALAAAATQPAAATKPTAPTNPFLHYKSLQGAARAEYFSKNQDQIWKAMEAMPANS